MDQKELRHMSRRELIEIIFAQKQRELELQAKLDEANEQLAQRTIQLENAGSIAEAAVAISGVFQAAQDAADRYLRSLGVPDAE